MNIIIFSGSNRKRSQSLRISNYLNDTLKSIDINSEIVDLHKLKFPLWQEDSEDISTKYRKIIADYSKTLEETSGFIFVVPEWHGMVPPQVKNLFFVFSNKIFSHKPGLIVAISDTYGGAYPVSELRSLSYKNKRICWIPDHIIIRKVSSFDPKNDERLVSRINYSCNLLIEYSKALKSIRNHVDYENFRNGM